MSWRFWVIKLRPTIKCIILCQTDELLLNTLLTKLHKSGTFNDFAAPWWLGDVPPPAGENGELQQQN